MKRLVVTLAALAACQAGPKPAARTPETLPEAVKEIFDAAETVELYSLDPSPGQWSGRTWHGWKVLGLTRIDAARKAETVAAVETCLADWSGAFANCFVPRHGVRAKVNFRVAEAVICFQCSRAEFYVDGEKVGDKGLGEAGRGVLDDQLRAANVPLATK